MLLFEFFMVKFGTLEENKEILYLTSFVFHWKKKPASHEAQLQVRLEKGYVNIISPFGDQHRPNLIPSDGWLVIMVAQIMWAVK